jgi:lipid-binding SYLF domain-containing protein
MKSWKHLVLPLACVVATTTLGAVGPALADQEDGIEKIEDAIEVFEEMMDDRDTRIPRSLIESSDAIAIIPDLAQGGFIVGARRGKGLMLVRQPDGTWSNPAFLTLTGGSLGLQAGGQSSDVILLFRDQDAIDDVLDGEFEFGVNASGTAGPVGQSAIDPTEFDGDILSYSRSSGLFGGVALEGGELRFDDDRNEDFYEQRRIEPEDIFSNPNLDVPEDPADALGDLYGALGLTSFQSNRPITSSSSSSSTRPAPSTTTGTPGAIAVYDLRKAKNAARQRAKETNGGLGNYQAEVAMHGPVLEAPYVTNPDGSWTFTFFGGQPGWEAYSQNPTVETQVTVFPDGAIITDYNGRVRR